MKTGFLSSLLALLMMTTCISAVSGMNVATTDPSVRLMGRALVKDGSATFGFPGQELELKFSGSKSVALKGDVVKWETWFNIYVDGVKQPVVNLREGVFTLPISDKLDAGKPHLVRVVRRSESCMGVVRVDGFILDDGAKLLPPDPLPSRKILAIGDSITCGLNTELTPEATPGNGCENSENSYAWLLANDFGAQVHLVSYSGHGLMRDWRGLNTATAQEVLNDAGAKGKSLEISTVGDFFERTLPDDPSTKWDHASYQPDVILICLGQNDFCQIAIPPSEFADAYIKFIDRVHLLYPNTPIIVLSSPMAETSRSDGWMPRGTALELAITIMDQHYIRQGDPIVMPVFVSHQPGTSLDTHPTAAQQRAIADEVKPILKFLTRWDAK
jgi:lysophospholipase L1-like esterase